MNFNRIFILGAGAVGSSYGALLSERNDVTLIGRKPHVQAIEEKGLSIVGDVKKSFRPKAQTQIRSVPDKSLVILSTKAYDSVAAIEGIRKHLRKDTIILILQNGLGNEEIVRDIVGDRAKVLRAVTKIAAEFLKPGKVRFWKGETIVESDEVGARIVETFNEAGLQTRVSEQIDREIWIKLVVNCVVNPLTALFRVKNYAIWTDTLKNVRHAIVEECIQVARAEEIELPANLAERLDTRLSGYSNYSSMYQDVARGKRTEIDFLNGKVVELGKKHGVWTPVNETLVTFIKFLEEENGVPRKN